MTALNKAMKLAYAWALGDLNLVNTEIDSYTNVVESDVINVAKNIFQETNCSTLYYLSNKIHAK
jgi:hypothetical protein